MQIINPLVINFNKIQFKVDDLNSFDFSKLHVINSNLEINIINSFISDGFIYIELSRELTIKYDCFVYLNEDQKFKCNYFRLYTSKEFNDRYYYDDKLGVTYSKEESTFKLWSPAALNVKLLLYKGGEPINEPAKFSIPLYEDTGLWSITIKGDLKNYFYNYEITLSNKINEAVDPYAKSTGINGLRGAIIDLAETNPIDWDKDMPPRNIIKFTDAIIYEINIRDISSNPNSGIINKGKFLGLTEENTRTSENLETGLSYLSNLGVTHIQIMPIFDFSYKSIDEKNPIQYNWGYDPENYIVPEGCYCTNPYDPLLRVKELKKMILSLHKSNLCVNVDVVFNHLWSTKENNFEKIFPGYYLRKNDDGSFSNGSGCGNDTASENLMMKKFIIDAVIYLAKEYHIDGFRFDLMGIHDFETMNKLREALNQIDGRIMLYGEGWDLNTNLSYEKKAIMYNSFKMPQIGHFNDIIRDSIKGTVFNAKEKGFISGKENLENAIKLVSVGCINYSQGLSGPFQSPVQSINYISCHDNYTLWDKLQISLPEDSDELRVERIKLGLGIVLTSQGIPFIHCGSEFCRNKKGIENSYNSPDEINWIDWKLKNRFINCTNYIQSLISLRRNHSAFRFAEGENLKRHFEFINNMPKNSVGFILKDNANFDIWNKIMVIYNANNYPINVWLPDGTWNVCVNKYKAGNSCITTVSGNYNIEAISINVLYKN
ncbi:type I pullulanase [Clostridium hydrogenum]|uniref:type I pullulanase n=1 Tax=Clostridium hydrogenum TaxID=2855764 RepID=UPI001F3F54E8|nr:type I pullulanase [Clostridium hydrogenum]